MATLAHTGDIPHIASASYASQLYIPQPGGIQPIGFGLNQFSLFNQYQDMEAAKIIAMQQAHQQKEMKPMSAKRRLVQVIIVDPNENVPLEQCVIYRGEQMLTDLTDQELFFELDIKDLLAKHNEKRVKLTDKKIKERVEHLEPAKVRDLKMVVVNIAEF